MVSEVRFYPTGFIGTEQAAVLVARLCYPDNWKPETFVPGEQHLWSELGFSLSAEFVQIPLTDLREEAIKAHIDFVPMRTRWVDFDNAMQDLQKALFAGVIVAECCDPTGRQFAISKEFWGGVHGVESLLRGLLQTTYPRAPILLNVKAVESLANSLFVSSAKIGSVAKRRPGRKKGGGSWELADRLLFSEMAKLIKDGKAASPQQAAGLLKDKIQGTGAAHNKAERVARRFRRENR
jgi:hypothetical protein